MENEDSAKKVGMQHPDGKRMAGRPKARFMDQVESDLQILKIKNWKALAHNREEWKKKVIEKVRIHPGSSSQI